MSIALQAIPTAQKVDRSDTFSAFTLATIVILTLCYWFIDHRWDQSVQSAGIDELRYTGAENVTADRLSEVNTSSTIARLAIAGWAFVCFLTSDRKIKWNSAFLWISIFLGCFVASSVLWSVKPKFTIFKLIVLLVLTINAFGFASRFSLRQMLNIICSTCCFFICMGVLGEIAHGTFRPWGDYRFIGTSHPNTLAIYGAVMCITARMYLVKDRSKLMAFALVTIGALVIVMTKSRTTLGAIVVGMLVTQIVSVRGNNRILLIAAGLFGIGVLSIATLFLSQQATGQLGNFAAMGRTDDVSSLTGRMPLWEELMTWVNKRPFLGYGYLAFWDADRVEKLSETFSWEIPHGHNSYLDIMLDVGMIGLFVYIVWFLSALQASYVAFSRSNRIEYAIVFGIGVLAAINGAAESLFKLPTFHLFVLMCCFSALVFENPTEPPVTDSKRKFPKPIIRR
jgi:exopolysaccharide production protein ExoQ